jgi:hypothetical protein
MAKPSDKARRQPQAAEEAPPQSFAQTTPEYAQPSHDFTLQAVMQVQRTLGEIDQKLDTVRDQIKSHGDKIDNIEKIVDRVKTGAIVGGVLISAFGAFVWWAIGDRVQGAVRAALRLDIPSSSAPAAPGKSASTPSAQPKQ